MATPYDHDWQRVRLQVLARDAHQCQIRLTGCTGRAEQVDHVIPLAEGGARLDPDNLRSSCRWCNLSRGRGRQRALADALGAQSQPSAQRW